MYNMYTFNIIVSTNITISNNNQNKSNFNKVGNSLNLIKHLEHIHTKILEV